MCHGISSRHARERPKIARIIYSERMSLRHAGGKLIKISQFLTILILKLLYIFFIKKLKIIFNSSQLFMLWDIQLEQQAWKWWWAINVNCDGQWSWSLLESWQVSLSSLSSIFLFCTTLYFAWNLRKLFKNEIQRLKVDFPSRNIRRRCLLQTCPQPPSFAIYTEN